MVGSGMLLDGHGAQELSVQLEDRERQRRQRVAIRELTKTGIVTRIHTGPGRSHRATPG